MGFNLRGDKSSLALLSSKKVKAYTRTKADEAFALPAFSDAMPVTPVEPVRTSNTVANAEHGTDHDSDNVKQTMLQHESVFKEQLHELHRLYQKQCMLMEESQKGHACYPHSEPPSSNSSLLYNSDSLKLHEDRSFGDASVSKPFYDKQNSNAFPTQKVAVKPEVGAECQKQSCERPMLDLEHPAECHPMLDLRRPFGNIPYFDLERPAEEYMHIELGKEKAQTAGLPYKSVDTSGLSSRHSAQGNGNFNAGENRDLVSQDPWRTKKLDFHTSYECKDMFRTREKIGEGYSQQSVLGHQCSDSKEDRLSPMRPFIKALDYSRQDSFSCASTSCHFRGLPDLNGELSSAENQTSLMQGKPDKNVNDRQYIDLEADSRPPNETSKLPHWLVQPPPKASRMLVPTNFSAQTSEWQQKATLFTPQMHDKPKSLVAGAQSPGEIMMTSHLQEPCYPWSHSKTTSQHRKFSFNEPVRQFFLDGSTEAAQGSYEGGHVVGSGKETIPSFFQRGRYNDKMHLSTASGVLDSVDRQGIVFDTHTASMELLSRISSRETTALSPVMPWYQQKESFSSLMQQVSNPEPSFHRQSFVSLPDPWQGTTSHQVLPVSNVSSMERSMYGRHSTVNNSEGPCVVTRPWKGPIFDFMPSSPEKGLTPGLKMRGVEVPTWKQVEKPFHIGQMAETTVSNNDGNLIPSRNAFDLNASFELLPSEEKLDDGHFADSRFHENQIQCVNQECDTIGGSGWDISRGNKAPHLNEQQKGPEPQVTGLVDRAVNKSLAFDVSTRDATLLPNEGNTFFTQSGTILHSQRPRLGNDTCADYCSGEDETGCGLVEVKSSDASGLTSCESRDAAHLESAKARDDSNTSSSAACQSRESGIPCHKEDVAMSSNVQSRSIGLLVSKENGLIESQPWGSLSFSTMRSDPGLDTKGDCSTLICAEFGDESEAANSITRKHSIETAEAAELLLSLGLDLPIVAEEGFAISDNEKSLNWLANIIPQEENYDAQVLGVDVDGMETHGDGITPAASMGAAEKVKDPFELAVLALKPIDPDAEILAIQTMDRVNLPENCSSFPSLRRRSSRKGRAGKDFQREVLQNMTSVSRQEIMEDLQIIEGLINSTAEPMNCCSLFPEDGPLSSPDSSSEKKTRGTKACRGRKPGGTSNVCSWGESTRRKRMGRQRSQRSCVHPGVQSSPFINNTGDAVFLM